MATKRLTRAELRLLTYPPTKETWECRAKRPSLGGSTCTTVNGGKDERCWVCKAKKPARPTRLWPKYEAACKKAGIEASGRTYRPGDSDDAPTPRKRRATRRRAT